MIDPDHSIFRTYRQDNTDVKAMAHIPYYGEDEKKEETKKVSSKKSQ